MIVVYLVLIVVFVAINATECCVITSDVAVGTKVPFIFVLPAVDGEIVIIMVKGRRCPGCFAVAFRTVG